MQNGSYTIDHNGEGSSITIDKTANSIDDAPLYLDNLGFYPHVDTGNLTRFSRIIKVVDNFQGNSDIVAASSTVRWRERGRVHDYVAETFFYNWR